MYLPPPRTAGEAGQASHLLAHAPVRPLERTGLWRLHRFFSGYESRARRKPTLLFLLFPLFLLRFDTRLLFCSLFHEPPRNKRLRLAPIFGIVQI